MTSSELVSIEILQLQKPLQLTQAICHTLISKFHNKNGILCSEANQNEQTNLGKDIDIH